MFRVGQKVVCVEGTSLRGYRWLPDEDAPVKGEIYTVLRAGLVSLLGTACIDLVEIKRLNGYHYGEWRFRPVVDTDISIFTAMLNPSLEDLRAIVRENANMAGVA